MRDILITPRTRRAQVASILAGRKERTAVTQAALAKAIAAGALAAIDTATFGLFEEANATDSVAITATDRTLTSADNPWVAGDVGKVIHIAGAGTAGAVLVSRIAKYASAGEVEIADAAVTTVAPTKTSAGGVAAWGWEAGMVRPDEPIRDASDVAREAGRTTPAGASSARSLASKLADEVTPYDFGAMGDGVTDDTVAVQAALDHGGAVFLPAGGFKISTVTVRVPLTLRGCGPESHILSSSVDQGILVDAAIDLAGIVLRDFAITGEPANTVSKGIYFRGAVGALVENVTVRDFGNLGIGNEDATTFEGCAIRHCTVENCGDFGIHLQTAEDCTVESNRTTTNATVNYPPHGIYIKTSNRVLVTHNIVRDVDGVNASGIEVNGGSSIDVSDNEIYDCDGFGIVALNTVGIVIHHNMIDTVTKSAVHVYGANQHVSVRGNSLKNATEYGIKVVHNGANVTDEIALHGNQIFTCAFGGVYVSNALRPSILGNQLGDPGNVTAYMVTLSGCAGALVVGNRIRCANRGVMASGTCVTLLICDNILSAGVDYGIRVDATCTGATVDNNNVVDCTAGSKVSVVGTQTKNRGTSNVADGGTVAHGLTGTPTKYGAFGTVSGHIVSVAAGAANLTFSVINHDGTPVGVAEPVSWFAEV